MKEEIEHVLDEIPETEECEIIEETEEVYEQIEADQDEWYRKSHFTCPAGCGKCCEHFEPDLLLCEAMYMAAWLIQNEPEVAQKAAEGVFPFDEAGRCPFFDPNSSYHCSIYHGRALICRLFGASCAETKDGRRCWRPCRFYAAEQLAAHRPPIQHRQYEGDEIKSLLGAFPPVMRDAVSQALEITPENTTTEMMREALPKALQKLYMIISFENP